MNRTNRILMAFVGLTFLAMSCGAMGSKDAKKTDEKTDGTHSKADVSYAFGVALGTSVKQTGVEIDYKKLLDGIKDAIEKEKQNVTMEEVQTIVQAAISDANKKKAEKNLAEEKVFLEKNGKAEGVKTTESGLQYKVIKEGDGKKPAAEDTVKIDYVGTFIDGKEFDSSVKAGEPAVFPVSAVIPGLSEGVKLMTVGAKYIFYIPSALAYGPGGTNGIDPNKLLIFEIELVSIEPPPAKK